MKKKKYRKCQITVEDFLLANRKASREEEIAAHGRQVTFRKLIQKSKKAYDRKQFGKFNIED